MTTHDHTDPADAAFDPTQDAGAERTSEDASAAALRMDLLGASSGGPDGAGAGAPRRFGGQAVLLGMVLLAAGGALFAMRYLGMGPRSSRGEEVKIDYDIDKAPIAGDHMRVLADLSANRSAEQVPPDQVQRNPFRLEGQLTVAKPDVPVDSRPVQDPAEVARRERARKIEAAFAGLELHTVLGGSNPIARISGKTVRPGDQVAEFFTVASIEGRSVSLECDGRVYVLSLSEEK